MLTLLPLLLWFALSASPETPPGSSPGVIGPGLISTPAEEFKATVSPDGSLLVYVVTDHLFRHLTLVQASARDGGWSEPRVASFSGIWRDGDPAFAPDGKSLLFISNRPLPGDAAGLVRRDYNIWSIRRNPDGTWGEPVALDRTINTDESEMAPSITLTGTIYFSRGPHIYRAVKRERGFDAPAEVPVTGGDPAISPDERFLVFDADGATPEDADLFISCRTESGWSAPSRFADPVNSPQEEGDPWVSADGHMLFFFSRRVTRAIDRAPRTRRATYAEIEREAIENIYNGSRNLYQVELTRAPCGGSSGSR